MKSITTLPALLILPVLLAACSDSEEAPEDSAAPPVAETAAEPAPEAEPTPESATDSTNSTVAAQPDAETNPRIVDALDFLPGNAGVAVFGRNIVLNVPTSDDITVSLAREVALSASNMSPDTAFSVFVVEGDAVASEVPANGDYICAVSASENMVQESTC